MSSNNYFLVFKISRIYKASLKSLFLILYLINGCSNSSNLIKVEPQLYFISNSSSYPIFSWKIISTPDDFIQEAYRIQIFDNIDQKPIWDSGKVKSKVSKGLKINNIDFTSGQKYLYKVKLWSNNGIESNWSSEREFHTPLNYPEDWTAKWITFDYDEKKSLPIFKKVFSIDEPVESARLYISAPGFSEAFINGFKIGDNVLDPAQTNYDDYAYYSSYNIPLSYLNKENSIGVMLGNGWYNQNQVWKGNNKVSPMVYGQPVFIAELHIIYKNGDVKKVLSDDSWFWTNGPITYSNIYGGETYDANLEPVDWSSIEISSNWKNVKLSKNNPNDLFEQFAEPIKKIKRIYPEDIKSDAKGNFIIDFGQNFTGWVELQISGKKGQEITMRFAEELDINGNLDPESTGEKYTGVVQTSKYICKGEGIEKWEPRFTYHGFRYVKVSGLDRIDEKNLIGIVIYSSFKKIGSFNCSEENINKLHDLADWTLIGNTQGIPTDCPHRERCGWTGDAHALAKSLLYNYDAKKFLTKYMFDMRSSGREKRKELFFGKSFYEITSKMKPAGIPTMIVPGKRTSGAATPDWGTAMVQIPWYLYLFSGEIEILKEFYNDMKVWVNYVHQMNVDGIIYNGLGDWCPPGAIMGEECPVSLSSTAFHILDVLILSKVAGILNKNSDEKFFSDIFDDLKIKFNENFFDSINSTYGSQTGNSLALDIGLVPDGLKSKVAYSISKNIKEKHDNFLSTGIFGIGRIFKALCENGQEEQAYKLLSKKNGKSFANMWEHFDATTLWEILPVNKNDDLELLNDRSHSHPMQSGYDSWFYSGIAGICPNEEKPGFKKITFKPYLTKFLKEVNASFESPNGLILSQWQSKKNSFKWKIQIPYGSTGDVWLPNNFNVDFLTINNKNIALKKQDKFFTYIGTFKPGTYTLEVNRY